VLNAALSIVFFDISYGNASDVTLPTDPKQLLEFAAILLCGQPHRFEPLSLHWSHGRKRFNPIALKGIAILIVARLDKSQC
jgi:hypothetical protein